MSADPVDAPTAEDEPPTPPRYFPEVAHAIREAGYSPLPLPEGQKHNPPDGWTGGDGAWTSAADVQAWADDPAHQKANTAARLPREVVGLDVDCYDGKPGAETWYELAKEHGKPPATWVVTARGSSFSGVRLFRLAPGFDQFLLGGGLPGIEIIRFGHRYVTAPGSVHPDLGTTYVATNLDTGEVLVNSMPPVANLPVLSLSWCEAFSKAARSQSKAKARAKVQSNGSSHAAANGSGVTPASAAAGRHRAETDGEMCKATLAAFTAAVADLHSGVSRHDSAVESTLSLLRHGDMGHQGVHKAISQLGAAYVAAKSTERVDASGTIHPALTASEAIRDFQTFADGALAILTADPTPDSRRMCCGTGAAGTTAGTENSSAPMSEQDVENERQLRILRAKRYAAQVEAEEVAAESRAGRTRRTMEEAAAEPPLDQVIKKTLAVGPNVLSGQSAAGKSLIAAEWAMHVAAGVPWLGHAVPEARSVLWIGSEDMDPDSLRERWTTHPLWEAAKARIEVVEPINLLTGDLDWMLSEYAAMRPGLIVMDLIYDCGLVDEKDPTAVRDIIAAMWRISAEWGAATLALGHPPLHGDVRRMRWSGVWRERSRTDWHAADGVLAQEKSKIGARFSAPFEVQYPHLKWLTGGQATGRAATKQEREMQMIKADLKSKPGESTRARAKRLMQGLGLSEGRTRVLIRQAIAEQLAEQP